MCTARNFVATDFTQCQHNVIRCRCCHCPLQAGSWSQTLQSAVSNLIDNHGITVVVATGNAQADACQITPANVNGTLAVAGSDMSSKFDTTESNTDILYQYDNTGSCVDLFAPGVDIMAACGGAGGITTKLLFILSHLMCSMRVGTTLVLATMHG